MPTQSLNKALQAREPFLFKTITDMTRKNYLPSDFKPFDPNIFKQLSYNGKIEAFTCHSCPECGITFYGPKKLLIEHHKIHARKPKNEQKENETIIGRYLEYRI